MGIEFILPEHLSFTRRQHPLPDRCARFFALRALTQYSAVAMDL